MIIGLITGVVIAISWRSCSSAASSASARSPKARPPAWRPSTLSARSWSYRQRGHDPRRVCQHLPGRVQPSAVVGGGAVGVTMKLAITKGVGRGVFSMRPVSAPRPSRAATSENPVRQGLYGIFEVFMDTIVMHPDLPRRPLLRAPATMATTISRVCPLRSRALPASSATSSAP